MSANKKKRWEKTHKSQEVWMLLMLKQKTMF